jgi:hypothetical protein
MAATWFLTRYAALESLFKVDFLSVQRQRERERAVIDSSMHSANLGVFRLSVFIHIVFVRQVLQSSVLFVFTLM